MMMMAHTMSSLNEQCVESLPDRGYSSAISASNYENNAEGSPHPSKRKRYENGSMNTPFRPRSSASATPKVNLEDDWFVERSQNNPVALPESVVELFRRPHVFPKDSYHELLKANGVSPKFYFKTSKNTAAFSNDSKITPDVIARRLQKKARRSSLDDQLQRKEDKVVEDLPASPDESWKSKRKGGSIITRSDGTYVVDVKGQQIQFAQVFINLQQLISSSDSGSVSNISRME